MAKKQNPEPTEAGTGTAPHVRDGGLMPGDGEVITTGSVAVPKGGAVPSVPPLPVPEDSDGLPPSLFDPHSTAGAMDTTDAPAEAVDPNTEEYGPLFFIKDDSIYGNQMANIRPGYVRGGLSTKTLRGILSGVQTFEGALTHDGGKPAKYVHHSHVAPETIVGFVPYPELPREFIVARLPFTQQMVPAISLRLSDPDWEAEPQFFL
jgi:hypothetical protein